jgi:hypothetical protein
MGRQQGPQVIENIIQQSPTQKLCRKACRTAQAKDRSQSGSQVSVTMRGPALYLQPDGPGNRYRPFPTRNQRGAALYLQPGIVARSASWARPRNHRGAALHLQHRDRAERHRALQVSKPRGVQPYICNAMDGATQTAAQVASKPKGCSPLSATSRDRRAWSGP